MRILLYPKMLLKEEKSVKNYNIIMFLNAREKKVCTTTE